ncbi:O-antigen ligase family protein [Sporosarcina sp. FA9]|uniref:O-antigen ligase family protein n=1 Tax=Sporosarcina sp. FA9 TaxID=3413030 RepID=UPI003F65622D
MQRTLDFIKSKGILPIMLLVIFTFAALALPNKIAIILTGIVFIFFALWKPFESLLYLLIYVAIRPYLIEINPGLKLIGDIITFTLILRLLVSSKFNLKTLLAFKWFELAFFGFLLFGSIIGWTNGVGLMAIIFQVRTFAIMYIIYYFISRAELPANWQTRFLWTGVALGWLLSIHGLIEKISLRQLLLPEYWKYMPLSAENMVRIYGLPGNPNSLALIMMFSVIAVIILKMSDTTKQYSRFLNTSIVLFLGIMILTFSRGTFISAFVLAAVYILLSKQFVLLKQLVIASVAALVLVYIPVNGAIKVVQILGVEAPQGTAGSLTDRFGQAFDEKNIERMTSNGRLFYLKKGFEIWNDYRITGAGFGTFGGAATISYGSPLYKDYEIDLSIYFENKIYSDNQYIQVIAETGVVGVALFATFLLGMLALFIKTWRSRFSQFMIALWLSTFISGVFYNIWELKVYTLLFFMILGIYACHQQWYKNKITIE